MAKSNVSAEEEPTDFLYQDGFEKRMDVEAMANLLAFLQQPDRRMLEQ